MKYTSLSGYPKDCAPLAVMFQGPASYDAFLGPFLELHVCAALFEYVQSTRCHVVLRSLPGVCCEVGRGASRR